MIRIIHLSRTQNKCDPNLLKPRVHMHGISTYHSVDHDDFRSDVFLDEEDLKEPQEEHGQCKHVEHSRPHKVARVECQSQDDGDEEEQVDGQVEPVPSVF